MKNKFLVIAAATTTALGTALVWTPAHAQITGSDVSVPLNITVPEVLFLKTVSQINLTISATDIANGLVTNGTGFYGSSQNGTASTSGSSLDSTSPFTNVGNGKSIQQKINNVYTVWSNSPRLAKGVNITFNKGITTPVTLNPASPNTGGLNYTIVASSGNGDGDQIGLAPKGLVIPTQTGGVTLSLDLNNATTAGTYTGVITITADAP
ncbi:hypothetical protein NIES4074_15190 [Cylindrospermum sp. NIES-4074]|nr:hypothetical protein NIES4074_15190 [Cylindrospermum sp. NIES-4074]